MRHSKIVVFIIFLIVLNSLNGCKKYEEDDVLIQWKNPEKRLIKFSPWKFEKLTVDGIDKTEEFRQDSAYFSEVRFFRPAYTLGHTANFNRPDGFYDELGTYEFQEKNKILRIGAVNAYINHSDYKNYGPIFTLEYQYWEILRLSRKGMTLKINHNSSEYILYLKATDY